MAKSARYAAIASGTLWVVNHSLLAMSALSLSVGRAMSMKGRMGTSLAPSAKLATRSTKVNEDKICCLS